MTFFDHNVLIPATFHHFQAHVSFDHKEELTIAVTHFPSLDSCANIPLLLRSSGSPAGCLGLRPGKLSIADRDFVAVFVHVASSFHSTVLLLTSFGCRLVAEIDWS